MKNMKKLLGAMAALGFTTVAAVNVVACNPQGEATNDLTKSFSGSYTANVATSDNTFEGLGLALDKDKTYNFKFSHIKDDSISTVITQSSATVPVNKGITVQDLTKIKNIAENDEIAQITRKTEDTKLVASGDNNTIEFKVTLKLFKAIKQSNKSIKYVDQNTALDVTIKIVTTFDRKDLSGLPAKVDVTNVTVQDLTDFYLKLKLALSKTVGYEAINRDSTFLIYKTNSTDQFEAADVVANPDLKIKIAITNSNYFKDGTREITVNLGVQKEDLDKILTNKVSIIATDVASFKSNLIVELAKDSGRKALTTDSKVTIKTAAGAEITAETIKTSPLDVKVEANDSLNFIGSKTITVTIKSS